MQADRKHRKRTLARGILDKYNQNKCACLATGRNGLWSFINDETGNPTTAKIRYHSTVVVFNFMEMEVALSFFFQCFLVVFFSGSWCSATTGEAKKRIFEIVQCESCTSPKCNKSCNFGPQSNRVPRCKNTLVTIFLKLHNTSKGQEARNYLHFK